MSNTSQTRAGSARHHTVDRRFVGLLEQDTGIPAPTVLRSLQGEPKKTAIAVAFWAADRDDPAGALLAWARKYQRGQYRRTRRNMTVNEQRAELDRRAA